MPSPNVPIRVVHNNDLYVITVDDGGEITSIDLYPDKLNRHPMSMLWQDLDPLTQIRIENELITYRERLHIRDSHDVHGLWESDQE